MKVRSVKPVAAAMLALIFLGCGAEVEETAEAGRPVTLERVSAETLVDRIEATGQLIPEQRAEIAAEVTGRVTAIAIDEGSAAEAGEVVLAIDPERRSLERDRARAQLDEARASLREQSREYERIKELNERNVASQTRLDSALTQLELARSRVDGARADLGVHERALEDATVRAPFSGLVAERFVSRGEFVAPGQKLVELVALDPIQVEFHVTEVDSSRVRLGQRVQVRVAPYPDEVFEAEVSVVSPTMDPRSRTLKVKGRIRNEDGRLRPGLFARVDLGVSERPDVPMIPEDAVLRRSDGAVVFRSNGDNRVERLLVETGEHRGGRVEVRGLAVGDWVVTRGHAALADGEVVVPRTPSGELVDQQIPDVATQ